MMWAQYINSIVGLWLMVAPAVFGYSGAPETNDRIVGPLVVTFAFVAAGEVTRNLRLVNVPIGAWLLIAPLLLGYPVDGTINVLLCGVIIIALSFVRGTLTTPFAGRWRVLFREDPYGVRDTGPDAPIHPSGRE